MITKTAYDAKQAELAKEIGTPDRWHNKAGALNAKGKVLKTRVFDYLDAKADHADPEEVRNFLCEEYSDDYIHSSEEESVGLDGKVVKRMTLNNRDVIMVRDELIFEKKVVE